MKMDSEIEDAISFYSATRSASALEALELALLRNDVLVPTSEVVKDLGDNRYDVPVVCLKTRAGDGAIPAFTTINHLLDWKPEGCKYVILTGKLLLEMALGMPEISEIVINVDGTPRGAIPRSEFERLIALS